MLVHDNVGRETVRKSHGGIGVLEGEEIDVVACETAWSVERKMLGELCGGTHLDEVIDGYGRPSL